MHLSSQYGPDCQLATGLDVTNSQEIQNGFAKTVEPFGRVVVVYNNGGYTLSGEAESI